MLTIWQPPYPADHLHWRGRQSAWAEVVENLDRLTPTRHKQNLCFCVAEMKRTQLKRADRTSRASSESLPLTPGEIFPCKSVIANHRTQISLIRRAGSKSFSINQFHMCRLLSALLPPYVHSKTKKKWSTLVHLSFPSHRVLAFTSG